MSKIVLDEIASGYQLSKVNENFQKIEDELNNKVLYRNPPSGEPNTVEKDIDFNGYKLYNVGDIQFEGFEGWTDLVQQATEAAADSEASRDAAAISEANAAASAADASAYAGRAVVRTFSGDGSTVAFDLVANPLNKENTQVFIGSVYQRKSTYSVSGNILTFNTAPPAGTNNIEVVIFESVLTESGVVDITGGEIRDTTIYYGDTTVEDALSVRIPEIANYAALRAYTGPITAYYVSGVTNTFDGGAGVFRVDAADTTTTDNGGTVLVDAGGRRWKREFGSSVDILWFGVDRTGATDSTAKIVAAANIAQYKRLCFPAGIYKASTLAVPSYSHWVGDGTQNTILKPNGAVDTQIILSESQHVEIEGIFINGDNGANGTAKHGINVYNSSHVYIHNNVFSGLTGWGVFADTSAGHVTQYITVENNTMSTWRSPVEFDSAGVALFEGTSHCNVLYNNLLQASYHGVLCQGRDFAASQAVSKSHKIVGNTINLKLAYGIVLYESRGKFAIANVANNGDGRIRITTSDSHPFATGNTVAVRDAAVATQANGEWVITVVNSTQFDLDDSSYSSESTTGGFVIPSDDNWHIIDGNTIYDTVGAVIEGASGMGIYVLANANVRVSNNHCYNTNISTTSETHACGGIGIGGSYGDVIVVGNVIERCNFHGIYVSTCKYGKTTVTGNTVRWNKKKNIFVSDSKGVVISCNTVYESRNAGSRGIFVQGTNSETEFSGVCDGLVIANNQISSFRSRGLEVVWAKNFAITGNSLINIGGDNEGISLTDCDQGTVTGNISDMKTSTGTPMYISRVTNTRICANTLIGGSGGGYSVFVNGTCTNTLFDETNSLSHMSAYNGSTGGSMHTRSATTAPANAARQVGDIHWNANPASGGTIGSVVTIAGDPPTWKSWGGVS